jgi:hypothetical protein
VIGGDRPVQLIRRVGLIEPQAALHPDRVEPHARGLQLADQADRLLALLGELVAVVVVIQLGAAA